MKVFDNKVVTFTYDFFDPTTDNVFFKQKLCHLKHEISPMVRDYFYQHTDKNEKTVTMIIKLLNELNTVLMILDKDTYPSIPKDKIIKNCDILEVSIQNAKKNFELQTSTEEEIKLIAGCIKYCITAINLQINSLKNLPPTLLFDRCKQMNPPKPQLKV